MTAKWKEKLKKQLKDDRGSALVLVIISIAFIGMLIAMMVYMVYYNYLMKYADRSAKNNFYTAESALAEIKAGVEKNVSDAMLESYYDVLSNHSADSAANQQAYFESTYREKLSTAMDIKTAIIGPGALQQTVNYYEPSLLKNYWIKTPIAADAGDEGARIETVPYSSWTDLGTDIGAGKFNDGGPVVVYKSGNIMELQHVRISYTDKDGYVSIIETDLAIETPEINFANVLSLPDLESYSLVSAGGIYNGYTRSSVDFEPEPTAVATMTEVTGNVYGGEDGIYVDGGSGQIKFTKKDSDPDTMVFTVTADSINASRGRIQTDENRPSSSAGIDVGDMYEVWARDLYVESATMNLDANCFIQDDLTLDGTYSKIALSGKYNGYGTTYGTASLNSAILINGAHSTLDFSSLKELNLAGHAYVGSIHYNAEEDDEENGDYIADLDAYKKQKEEEAKKEQAAGTGQTGQDEDSDILEEVSVSNNSDVLMGQSVAVKSDQLMYMVPAECMGYDGDSQICGKNPMTYDEYIKFATTYEPLLDENGNISMKDGKIVYSDTLKYTVVRLSIIMNKLGKSPNSYGATYTPVFRRVNGSILVYFYLKFASDDKANEFFRDYYEADKEAFTQYMSSYVDSYTINSDITRANSGLLSIAGNMLYMRNGNVLMAEDTLDEDLPDFESQEASRQQYETYYQSLSKFLMKTTDSLSATMVKSDVFSNIVISEDEFSKQVSSGKYKTYKNTDDKVVAVVVNNKNIGVQSLNALASADLHLVIATGDVLVDVPEFDGLIICGGDIYIASNNKKINYDAAEVQKAMTAKNGDGNYAFEVIQNGIAYANSLGTTDADLLQAIEDQKQRDVVRASDLVKYVNWNKE